MGLCPSHKSDRYSIHEPEQVIYIPKGKWGNFLYLCIIQQRNSIIAFLVFAKSACWVPAVEVGHIENHDMRNRTLLEIAIGHCS